MTQIATSLTGLFNAAGSNVRLFTNAIDFALHLATLKGHKFLRFNAVCNMDEGTRMNKTKRGDKKTRNPFIGRGLRKFSRTQATVSFDYAEKVERRDGERGETEGNWSQALIVKGKLTPLSIHKSDIVTRLKDGIDPNDENEANKIANQVAVMDAEGTVQIKVPNPRLYLRYEIQRDGGEGERHERRMRSESVYVLADGTVVDKKELADYLPPRPEKKDNTDFQVRPLETIQELSVDGAVWRRTDAVDVDATIERVKAALAAMAAFQAANAVETYLEDANV